MPETPRSTSPPPTDGAVIALPGQVADLLEAVRDEPAGRVARTLLPGAGAPLKQTLLALRAGHVLRDHRAPGSATLQVLAGRLRLTVGDTATSLTVGDWVPIPDEVHGVAADEDCVALLSVAPATRPDREDR